MNSECQGVSTFMRRQNGSLVVVLGETEDTDEWPLLSGQAKHVLEIMVFVKSCEVIVGIK